MVGHRFERQPGSARIAILTLAASLTLGAGPRQPDLRSATVEAILDEVRRPGAEVVLVNVWATWCQPCREEMPDLLRLRRAYADLGFRLVLVSGDFPDGRDDAVEFLREQGVDFPSFIKEGKDEDFIEGLSPDWSGALPATFVYDRHGALTGYWEGKGTYERFERLVLDALGSGASGRQRNTER